MTPVFLVPHIFSMSSLSADIIKLLSFNGELSVILTVGNPFRSDDGVGPYIASKLSSTKSLMIIDAQYNPENVIEDIVSFKPKRILVIDAADFRGIPGEARLIDGEHIPDTTLSTHSIPLPIVTSILIDDTGARVDFLGIQPKSVEMGEGLSEEIRTTADIIISNIKKGISHA
jgi:hydrogenase 3 maturation protease